jgi:hypothetical protein
VRYLAPRGLGRTAAYQRYYLLGLEDASELRWDGPPLVARLLPGVDSKYRLVYNKERALVSLGWAPSLAEGFVGRYVVEVAGTRLRVAIDAHDAREVRDENALAWSDVYFKSNRWASHEYDAKVRPLVNGNGLLDRKRLDQLRRLRGGHREVDVAFISNVYGGRAHVLRMFEQLAALPLRTDLLAIFDGADPQADARETAQLRSAGVPVSRSQLSPSELWTRLARAEIVLLRSGRHGCVSWRLIDLLCMGACVLIDAPLHSPWPVPLREGWEFANCGIDRPLDGGPPSRDEYDKLSGKVIDLLERPALIEQLRGGAARYFDEHAAPARVAQHILQVCAAELSPGFRVGSAER